MKGRFVLRIEDTDVQRSTRESVEAIFEALTWLQIDWDDGPYYQSKRMDVYLQYLEKLLDSGHAYYCTCSPEQVDAMRKRAIASGDKPKYDGTCREKRLKKTENAVVRFKSPTMGTTVLEDVVKGNIVFQNAELDDFVILRSDGTPTYNFAAVIDDITLGINMVLRGDDHVNNTPRQIHIYKALDVPLPAFGHLPMVLGGDKTRLSKRHGAVSVTVYRDMGYLPDALINYLVRLGWSHGDQEFFTRDDLIEKFNIESIGRAAGIFNPEKLLALNADHIKATAPEKLAPMLIPFLKDLGYDTEEGPMMYKIIQTLNTRSKTLKEMAEAAVFFFEDPTRFDEKGVKKLFKRPIIDPMKRLVELLEKIDSFDENALEEVFKKVMNETGLKLGKIAQPVRLALTGKTVSPGIFEIIEILGKAKTINRLQNAIQFMESQD
jgi:glutamyl-tRNA synthetase